MFYDNYVKLCNSINKKPSAVAIEMGISKSLVSRWKNGGGVTDSTAQKVADYFGVPVSELTGEQKEKADSQMGTGLEAAGPNKKALLESIKDLSEAEAALVFERIQKIKESR